jgi:hypothetical protein
MIAGIVLCLLIVACLVTAPGLQSVALQPIRVEAAEHLKSN